MKTPNRSFINFISQHAELHEEQVARVFEAHVYPDKRSWQKFLSITLLVLGLGFIVSGIIFFFAFNWDKLTKFEKLGLVGGLLSASVLLSITLKVKPVVRQIMITASAILVGALFAVFGQIYQTGANSYDFFLAWTIFATLWVWAGNFPPLTSIWLILAHVTYFLYVEQFGVEWGVVTICLIVFIADIFIWLILKFLDHAKQLQAPGWMLNVLSAFAVYQSTIGMCVMIYDAPHINSWLMLATTLVIYASAIWYAFKQRSIFYVSIIGASVTMIVGALILQLDRNPTDGKIFLLMTLYVSGAISLLVYQIIQLQKKWANEKDSN